MHMSRGARVPDRGGSHARGIRIVVSGLVVALVALVVAARAAPPAAAEDQRGEAERYFRTGERLFNAGEFSAAAASFEDAFEILPLPAIAFSAAQAYRLAWVRSKEPARLKRAVELYRIYLDKVKTGERVTDATTALGELEPQLRLLEAGGAIAGGAQPRQSGLMITSEVSPALGKVGNDPRPAGALPLVRELPPGDYDVTVEARGYVTRTIKATVIAGELVPVEVDLEAMPATIVVKVGSGATVSVDGRVVGTSPIARPLAVDAGRHFVTITRRGSHAVAREVELARGESITLEPRLRTTGQRKIARVVLGGSGVLLVGAGLAGLGALGADSDAADLDQQRQTTGITPAALARYQQLRQDRDALKTTMWGLGGAAVVVGTTGLLLYLFDREQPEAPSAPLTGGRGGVTLIPSVGAGAAGLVVRGGF